MCRVIAVLALFGGVLGFACARPQTRQSTPAQPSGPALYDRLGRMDAIKDIVKAFVEQQLVNGPLAARFTSVDVARFEDLLAIQLCELSGGPCKYTGRPMRDVHTGMAITDAELSAFLAGLQTTLVGFNVDAKSRDELLGILRAMRDDIVAGP